MYATATYSPQDNKLRLYFPSRLSEEDYKRVKEAGYKWAPKQDCFVAPMWTPSREDLALSFLQEGDEIEDETMTLEERAEQRASRFEGYKARRIDDARSAHRVATAISENIPFGQPILIGHHSEKRARKDKERIEASMDKAVKMWDTAEYWSRRADASLAHAQYKERHDVRYRRRKGIIADLNKAKRDLADAEKILAFVATNPSHEETLHFLNVGRLGFTSTWYSLQDKGPSVLAESLDYMKRSAERSKAHLDRWIAHYNNRIAYETVCLQGWEPPKYERPKKELKPLLNFDCEGAEHMTSAEWKRCSRGSDSYVVEERFFDGRWTGWREAGDFRQRCRRSICNPTRPVFITDMKAHPSPIQEPALVC